MRMFPEWQKSYGLIFINGRIPISLCMIQFQEAKSAEDFQQAVELFKEYADQIDTDLSFQKFEEELDRRWLF